MAQNTIVDLANILKEKREALDRIHNPSADRNTISFYLEGQEVFKISPEGFWIRGQLVPQDEREAQAVYNGMRELLVWAQMVRP